MRLRSIAASILVPIAVCAAPMAISTIAFNAMAVQDQSLSSAAFVQKASIANRFEIESSKLALQQSSRDDVKAFAQNMIDDHSKTANELKDTLAASNSDLAPADKLDPHHQKLLAALKNAGDRFDTLYIQDQTRAHQQAVTLFNNYATNGEDPALKQFASDTLPALKTHLHHVESLNGTPN